MTNDFLCGIIITEVKGSNPKREAHESDVRPVPDDPTARCVGLRYTNVNQSRLAEEMTDYAYYKAKKIQNTP